MHPKTTTSTTTTNFFELLQVGVATQAQPKALALFRAQDHLVQRTAHHVVNRPVF